MISVLVLSLLFVFAERATPANGCNCLPDVPDCEVTQPISVGATTTPEIVACSDDDKVSWTGTMQVCQSNGEWVESDTSGQCTGNQVFCYVIDGQAKCANKVAYEAGVAAHAPAIVPNDVFDANQVSWKQFLYFNAIVSALTSLLVVGICLSGLYWCNACKRRSSKGKGRVVWKEVETEEPDASKGLVQV